MSDGGDGVAAGPALEVLVTAQEAYPRLEELFLEASDKIEMGFRLFDLRTKLKSPRACAIGEIWADLFVHTLNRGIPITLTVSDFDPVMAHDLHEQAWRSVAISQAVNEMAAPEAAKLTTRAVQHPAKGGIVPRLVFAASTRRELKLIVHKLNGDSDPAARLQAAPGLGHLLCIKNDKISITRRALPELHPVTLHHKMAVFDAQTTYLGGLDLNERRVDGLSHDKPAQQTWHDLQLIVRDPAVATSASIFLASLRDVISGKAPFPTLAPPFLNTVSKKRDRNAFHLAPETVNDGLLQAHIAQIARAKRFIYLETQYFRDHQITSALVKASESNPDLRLIVLLPAAPEEVAFDDEFGLDGRFGEYLQARSLRRLQRAFGKRFLAASPVQPRRPDHRDVATERSTLTGAPIVYVHSKVSIFDASAAIVASANLNGRSMKWDAEAGILLDDPAQVEALASKVYEHWLGEDTSYDLKDPYATWYNRAQKNAQLKPEQRTGFVVPHDLKPAARIGLPVPGAPEEMV